MSKKLKLKGFKLNRTLKRKWLTLLRSDKFEQGTGELYDEYGNTYCCLGVLGVACKVPLAVLEGSSFPENIGRQYQSLFPKEFLSSEEEDVAKILADYNDAGKSFKWIASYIERYL